MSVHGAKRFYHERLQRIMYEQQHYYSYMSKPNRKVVEARTAALAKLESKWSKELNDLQMRERNNQPDPLQLAAANPIPGWSGYSSPKRKPRR